MRVVAEAARSMPLNPDQQSAASAIVSAAGSFAPFLLQGVTGSGKTEVYLAAAAECMAAGGQVLILVPEINLTPQFRQRIAAALPTRRTVTLHSRLPARRAPAQLVRRRERRGRSRPRHAARGLHAVAAARAHRRRRGARSVVQAAGRRPLPRPRRRGLARAATGRARGARQRHAVARDARPCAERRAIAGRSCRSARSRRPASPPWSSCRAATPTALEGIGAPLEAALAARLARGEQSLVFVNRRGFALSLLCSSCGWQAGCPRCSARLIVHRETTDLRCHHCGHRERLARACPECGNVDLVPLGHGTQRLERALAARFPGARIERIDRDSTRRKGAFAGVRERVHAGDVDILVGTQMLAKGHDFPRLTLVGVVGADNALYSGDFRATERLAALLFQVAGRAGRADLARRSDPADGFSDARARALARGPRLRELRRNAACGAARGDASAVRAPRDARGRSARSRDVVDAFLAAASDAGRAAARAGRWSVEVFPPVPASLPRRAGLERGQVLAHAIERSDDAALPSALARSDRGLAGPPRALGARRRSAGIRVMHESGAECACSYNPLLRRLRRRNDSANWSGACRAVQFAVPVPNWPMVADVRRPPMTDLRTELKDLLTRGVVAVAPERAATPIELDRPKQPEHGDFASNVALQHAKALSEIRANSRRRWSPRCRKSDLVEKIEIAGAGFINIFVTPAARQAVVQDILAEGERFGRSESRRGERVMVEFVSANPTGPLHVGHGRQAALGDALARLIEWQGAAVTREFYYNDAGQQIENLAVSVRVRAQQLLGEHATPAGGRLSRRLHPRTGAALSGRGRPRPRRHRIDTPVRGGRAAARAGPRPHGVRRAVRQLLPRKLALLRRARGRDDRAADGVGQDVRGRRRAVAQDHRVRRRQGSRDEEVGRRVHVFRARRRVPRDEVGARLHHRRSTCRAPTTTARSRACAPDCRRRASASRRAIPPTSSTRWSR